MHPSERFFGKAEVALRYDMTVRHLNKLLQHPDPERRFPAPTLVVGLKPGWSEADLDRFDAEQAELSKRRSVRQFDEPYMRKSGQARVRR
jgi:hypothetical protein